MYEHTPRLWKALITLISGTLTLGLGGYYAPDGWPLWACLIAAAGLLAASVFEAALLAGRERITYYDTIRLFGEMLSGLDPSDRDALGIQFPSLRLRWTGQPVIFFEDTDATQSDFERFMRDGNGYQISPMRHWSTGPQRHKWESIRDWLISNQYIYADSAAGSHSWLWRGDMYRVLWQRYMETDNLPDLTQLESQAEMEAA